MDKCEAVCVDPSRITEIWPHVSHFIKAAMLRGDLGSFKEVESDVLAGDALLWLAYRQPVIEAAAITQVTHSDSGKVCTIVACGGSQHERWIDLIGGIENYAHRLGCRKTRIIGRKGWQRVLPNYAAVKVILERAL